MEDSTQQQPAPAIPAEAVEAAVDALLASRLGDHAGISGEEFVEAAQAALEAAAPFIRAQALEDAAKELARLEYKSPFHPDRAEYERVLAVRRGNADGWLKARAEAERSN